MAGPVEFRRGAEIDVKALDGIKKRAAGVSERGSDVAAVLSEISRPAKDVAKKPLSQDQADRLVAKTMFAIALPAVRQAPHTLPNVSGIVQTIQNHTGNPDVDETRQWFSSVPIVKAVDAFDRVRDKMGHGEAPRYPVAGLDMGKTAGDLASGDAKRLFGAIAGLGKKAYNATKLQPDDKKGPLTTVDIDAAEVALVARNGVAEPEARRALGTLQQMKGYFPPKDQELFDSLSDRVRDNVAKPSGPQTQQEMGQDPRRSPKPAVSNDAELGDGVVECSPLQMLEKGKAALTGAKGPNCKTPEAKGPAPSGGGFSMGGS